MVTEARGVGELMQGCDKRSRIKDRTLGNINNEGIGREKSSLEGTGRTVRDDESKTQRQGSQ